MQERLARNTCFVALGSLLLVVAVLGMAACESSVTGDVSGEVISGVCGESSSAEPLLVSAAAGLRDAFAEVGQVFDLRYTAKTTLNLAASGVLQKQIEGEAPVDVFASADPERMNSLLEAGLVEASSAGVFARNEIVLVVPADSTLGITGFQDLAKDSVTRVATGDPRSTTIGEATFAILPKLDLLEAVEPKLIYAQTVNQAVDYVARGEVDAGIVWSSEATPRGDRVKIVAAADPAWHDEGAFVIGIVTASDNKVLGQTFVQFVLGSDGQSILEKHCFLAP